MLKAIIFINIFQLIYFNCSDPSFERLMASVIFALLLASTRSFSCFCETSAVTHYA